MADDDGVMNRSVADTTGEVLVVSQFTLYGDTDRGRRPSWLDAAPPEQAEPLVDLVVARLRDLGATVATGRFRTDMQVEPGQRRPHHRPARGVTAAPDTDGIRWRRG